MSKKIQQPKNQKHGSLKMEWNPSFSKKWDNKYNRAQALMDSEVLRLCEPYVPMITGILKQSGTLGTKIGTGLVSWIAVYAQRVYYQPNETIGRHTGPLRGKLWFERMKADKGQKLIESVKRYVANESK